jgi:hypothetical protein
MNAMIQQPVTVTTFTEQFNRRARALLLRAAADALRAHPDATLGDLVDLLAAASPALRSVTIAELLEAASHPIVELRGPDFDALVLRALAEHEQRMQDAGVCFDCGMSRAELIARVGGARWKLQASMGRLVGAGKVERSGVTSGTRYRLIAQESGAGNDASEREVGPACSSQTSSSIGGSGRGTRSLRSRERRRAG